MQDNRVYNRIKAAMKLDVVIHGSDFNSPCISNEVDNMVDSDGRICGSVDYTTGVVSLQMPVAAHIKPAETSNLSKTGRCLI